MSARRSGVGARPRRFVVLSTRGRALVVVAALVVEASSLMRLVELIG